MAPSAGTAYIDILPDFSAFTGELKQSLARIAKGADATVDVKGDTDPLTRHVRESLAWVDKLQADVTVDADTAPMRRNVDQAADKVEGRFKKLGGSIKEHMKGIGAAAGATLAAGVTVLGKTAVDAASDVNESLSKNVTLFGKYAADIETFSGKSAKSFGISKRAALEYTGTFGNLFNAIGVTQKKSAGMSTNLVKLAADMASFNNSSIEDALDALKSGLVGESEPLRKFGVTLSADAIAVEALRSGIVKTKKSSLEYRDAALQVEVAEKNLTEAISKHGKGSVEARQAQIALEKTQREFTKAAAGGKVELTAQQKAMASVALITKQTSAAQGDFAKTSGGLANQQRIASARIEDLKVKLGQFLLPAIGQVALALNGLVDGISGAVGWMKEHKDITVAVGAALATLTIGLGGYAAATKIAALGTAALNAVLAANPITLTVVALAALAAGIYYAYQKSEAFREIVDKVWGGLRDFGQWIADVGVAAWEKFGGVITAQVQAIAEYVQSYIGAVVTVFKGAIDFLAGVFTGDWGRAWDGIKAIFTGIWDAIVAGFKLAWETLKNVVRLGLIALVELVKAAAPALLDLGKWLIGKVIDGVKAVPDVVAGAAEWALRAFIGAVKATPGLLGDVGEWMLRTTITGLKGAVELVSDLGGWLKNRLMDGLDAVKDGFLGAGRTLIGWVADGIKAGVNAVLGFVQKIADAISSIPGVPDIHVPKLATGGTIQATDIPAQKLFSGGKVTRPMAIVGEEAPRHPEYVIPTNPAYRGRAIGLHARLSKELGIPGYAKGGVLGTGINLPSPTDLLPDWLVGTGKWVIGKVSAYIGEKISNLIGSAIPDVGGNVLDPLIRMVESMNKIDARGFDYVYGGGHSSFNGPYDCSGLVSAILHAGGFLDGPITTDGLKVFGESGDGQLITIGVRGSTGRNAHTMMRIGGKYLESGSGHGARWVNGWSGNFPIHRHPPGFAKGGILDRNLLEQLLGDGGLGWGLAHGGTIQGPFVGSYKLGGIVPQDGLAHVHAGERITPAGQAAGPLVHVGQMNVRQESDIDHLAYRLAWLTEMET